MLKILLDKITSTNQLIEACKIYLSNELFFPELEALAFFIHNITFPFLNMVERSSHADLLKIWPQLQNDLMQKKTDTLKKYIVISHGVNVTSQTFELGQHIINLMCTNAADGILMQFGWEYSFPQDNSLRATDITTLNTEDLNLLPSNNLKAERNLAEFDWRASIVAKCRNFKFTAKSIRNDVLLSKRNNGKVEAPARTIIKLLNERELRWNEKQSRELN